MVKMNEVIYTNKVIDRIKAVLDSDLSAYEIAKQVGYSSANQVHNFRNGKSDYTAMKLSTAIEFEKIYNKIEEEQKLTKEIMEIIKKVEDFEIELSGADPSYEEVNEDNYIAHFVAGFNIEVLFAEHEHVKEAKEEGTFDQEHVNELADLYDYDKVVGYRIEGGNIKWNE